MARQKIIRWKRARELERFYEAPPERPTPGPVFMAGEWHSGVFGNDHPLTLDIGCGHGDFLIEMARLWPERNFIGVDKKGHRMVRGAESVLEQQLCNLAFLRAGVQWIDRYFVPGEVGEIWLQFSDPQPADAKGTKRITSPIFVERYRRILKAGGRIHVKTDSELLYRRTLHGWRASGFEIFEASEDVHGELLSRVDDELRAALEIQSRYESRWLAEGRTIRYLGCRA